MGGGAASSMYQGENKEDLDFGAVQRGDAEMEQKVKTLTWTYIYIYIHMLTSVVSKDLSSDTLLCGTWRKQSYCVSS